MYPHELYNFINDRNNWLGGDDLLKAISVKENPQLTYIKYNAFDNRYEMWDRYGNYYNFNAILYEEYQKTLKKKL